MSTIRGRDEDLGSLLVVNIVRTYNQLSPFIDAGLRDQKLTAAQLNALLALRSAGSRGLLMGELGGHLVVTKSNVTGLVDRLERQGLAARKDDEDRRAKRVVITAKGAGLLERALPAHRRRLFDLTMCLTASQKRKLIVLLSTLRRALRAARKER